MVWFQVRHGETGQSNPRVDELPPCTGRTSLHRFIQATLTDNDAMHHEEVLCFVNSITAIANVDSALLCLALPQSNSAD